MFVIGGSAAISSGVVAELDDLGVQVQRITGDDRQETATAVARAFVDSGRLDGAAGVAEFELLGTADQPLPAEVALALFSCTDVDPIGPDRTFADANGDGLLDGVGTTDTGQAAIAVVNGVDIPDTTVVDPATPDGGTLSFSVASLSPDCTVPVIWDDENGNGELDLDASDQPVEPYNVGQATFQ